MLGRARPVVSAVGSMRALCLGGFFARRKNAREILREIRLEGRCKGKQGSWKGRMVERDVVVIRRVVADRPSCTP